MNALFDLENGIYTDLIVQKEHEKNECKALCQMADRSRISGKVILLADRNYESCNNLAHLEKKGWNYLIRVRDKERVIAYGTPLPDQPEFDIPLKLTLGRLTRGQLEARGIAVPEPYYRNPPTMTFDFEITTLPGALAESPANSPLKIQDIAERESYSDLCSSCCYGQRPASALNQCPAPSKHRFPMPTAQNHRPRQILLYALDFHSGLSAVQSPPE